jgi:hypothetical protein
VWTSQVSHDGADRSDYSPEHSATAPFSAPPARQSITTNPYVGIIGVFLGAALATLNSRLLSVGLADLRGAPVVVSTKLPGFPVH